MPDARPGGRELRRRERPWRARHGRGDDAAVAQASRRGKRFDHGRHLLVAQDTQQQRRPAPGKARRELVEGRCQRPRPGLVVGAVEQHLRQSVAAERQQLQATRPGGARETRSDRGVVDRGDAGRAERIESSEGDGRVGGLVAAEQPHPQVAEARVRQQRAACGPCPTPTSGSTAI